MIRIVVHLMLVMSLSGSALSQQRHFGRLDGEAVSVVLTSEQLASAPTWKGGDEEPSLSVGKAIRAAKSAVATEYPGLKVQDGTVSVAFLKENSSINSGDHFTDRRGVEYFRDDVETTIVTDCWVYWIRLTWTPVVGNGLSTQPSPSVPVAVLMDGTALLPSKIIKPLAEPEFTSRYRKLQSP